MAVQISATARPSQGLFFARTVFWQAAATLIRSARYLTAFTGAGISMESSIPPFRGPGDL